MSVWHFDAARNNSCIVIPKKSFDFKRIKSFNIDGTEQKTLSSYFGRKNNRSDQIKHLIPASLFESFDETASIYVVACNTGRGAGAGGQDGLVWKYANFEASN